MDKHIHCTDCIYKNLCTPFEKLLYTKNNIKNDNITEKEEEEEECVCFIDINEFDNNYTNGNIKYDSQEHVWHEMSGETAWKEMSWNKYTDNLLNYIEDN